MLFNSELINVEVSSKRFIIQFRQKVSKSLVLKLQGLLETIQSLEEKINLVFFPWFSESIQLFNVYYITITVHIIIVIILPLLFVLLLLSCCTFSTNTIIIIIATINTTIIIIVIINTTVSYYYRHYQHHQLHHHYHYY